MILSNNRIWITSIMVCFITGFALLTSPRLTFAFSHFQRTINWRANVHGRTSFMSRKHAFQRARPLHVATYQSPSTSKSVNSTNVFNSLADISSFITETEEESSFLDALNDPSFVEFVSDPKIDDDKDVENTDEKYLYPFVSMLRSSAGYISEHRDKTAVFHIPGEMVDDPKFSGLLDDISLCWLFGLKIVLVVSASFRDNDSCNPYVHTHECTNSLRVTSKEEIQKLEEETGYLRCEIERRLNKRLRVTGKIVCSTDNAPAPNGNVVSGNFYTAKPFKVVHGIDYKCSGMPNHLHVEQIKKVHAKNDVVLLTTVGTTALGDPVTTNGDHLAAYVAANLGAHKLVYFSQDNIYLRHKSTKEHLQDVKLSFTKSLVDYYNVQIHKAGFASFDDASKVLDPSAVEMLLHLGWSNWALENGHVKKAHIVSFSDGALLEELYSAHHGSNTCVCHDDEHQDDDYALDELFAEFPTYLGPPLDECNDQVVVTNGTPAYS